MTMISSAEFKQRRQTFMQKMQANSIAIIPGAVEYLRNGNDGYFPFRQNSDFYYLTGFNEPEAVAVLVPNHPEGEYWLFNLPRDPKMETWNGYRAGQEGAKKIYQADCAYPCNTFDEHSIELLKNREILYFAFGRQMAWDRRINKQLVQLRAKTRAGINVPQTVINPEVLLHEMRLHKSAAEIAAMRKAGEISIDAHYKAMQHCRPGVYEYELQAVIIGEFTRQRSFAPAYYPIIGSGENSCILHYHANNRQIQANDIVLIDAGAEFENYAADITRSFPANGKFSATQKAIYDIVLRAQLAAIEKIKPGTLWPTMQETVVNVITEGLVDLGILKGKTEDLIEQKAYSAFYMHAASHWLGLDTHDVGNYKPQNAWRKMAPGMVLTVEPGIYIPANTPEVDEKWWNIGIRIEDDVLVTTDGYDVLTGRLPKSSADIEALMQQ